MNRQEQKEREKERVGEEGEEEREGGEGDRRAAGPGQRVWTKERGRRSRRRRSAPRGGERGHGAATSGRPGTRRLGQSLGPGLAWDPRWAPGDTVSHWC